MRAGLILAVALMVACGGGDGPIDGAAGDGGGDAAVDGIAAPAPPASPAPPDFGACPPGWSAAEVAGVAVCEPWPGGVAASCPEGEMQLPGRAGCVTIGAPCPTGGFAEDLPTDRPVLFASAGALSGDGTEARPFGTLGDALAAGGTGVTVAVGKGTYDEVLALRPDVTLHGACVAATRITTADPSPRDGMISITGPGAVLRALRLGPSSSPAVAVRTGGRLRMQEVEVVEATGTGLAVQRLGELDAERLLVRDGVQPPGLAFGGRGLEVIDGTARLVDTVFERNHDVTLAVIGPDADASLDGVVIRGTLGRLDTSAGLGVSFQMGAQVTITSSVLEQSRRAAIAVDGDGSALTLEDSVVRDTLGDALERRGGYAVSLEGGAAAAVRRSLLTGNRHASLWVYQGSSLEAEDVVVHGTASSESGGGVGRGVNVQSGSTARLDRVVVSQSREAGVVALGEGVVLEANDLVVMDTESTEMEGRFGRGLEMSEGATATVRRALIRDNRDCGVCVEDDVTFDAEDLIVTDTRGRASDGGFGRAMGLFGGSTSRVARVFLRHNREMGVNVQGEGTSLSIADLRVEDTLGEEGTGQYGRGVDVEDQAIVTVERASIASSRDVGAMVVEPGSSLEMTDVELLDTVARDCVVDTCPGLGAGSGAGAYLDGRLVLTRFRIRGAALCGVQLADRASVDLHDGEIAEAEVGICLQVPDYDLERLTASVAYRDNGVNLQTTTLPVPDASSPL